MIDDQQTHTVPDDPIALDVLVRFAGFPDQAGFSAALLDHLQRVERHYAGLFAEEPSLSHSGNLVFTGVEHDPETLATIARLGYRDPETISGLIRGWHHGRARAMRSARARELLTELVPHILRALAASANPDDAFRRFDTFLGRLPAGAQFFALLEANPALLDLLAEVLGSAPQLADRLARTPALLDSVLSRDFLLPVPDHPGLAAELGEALGGAAGYEESLEVTRRWSRDRQFQASVQFLRGHIDARHAGEALSSIADTAIAALLPLTQAEFAGQHGRIPDGTFAVLALGKLGARELTATSDLDLVFVYDTPAAVEFSDGGQPLAVSHYYARFAPRFLNALSAPTAEGKLYDVDLRLRPAGNKGPLASAYSGFAHYLARDAWTWEHMALTRTRFIAGDTALRDKLLRSISNTLVQTRDPERLLADVADMRRRIAAQHSPSSPWDIKYVSGGLVDLEFVAQYLMLREAAQDPRVLSANTADAFERLGAAGVLQPEEARALAQAARFWQQIQAMLRLTVQDKFEEALASEGLKSALARSTGATDFAALRQCVEATAARVRAAYTHHIEEAEMQQQRRMG
jgi:glutamate-ammonia-ligase adenylyltransferase